MFMIKQIVIIAGGQATRLFPVTEKIPKSMVLINNKPFLEYQLELCKKNHIYNVVLCVGHFWKQIEKYFGDGSQFGMKILYSVERKKLDTGGALKNAWPHLDDKFFVMYGDSYLDINWSELVNFHKKTGTKGTMTVYKNNWKIEPSKIILDKTGRFIEEFNKDNPRKEMKYTEYGLNILSKDIISDIKELIFPIGRYFDCLIGQRQLSAYISTRRFYEIGCPKGLEDFREYIKEK